MTWDKMRDLLRSLVIAAFGTFALLVAVALLAGQPPLAFVEGPGAWVLGVLVVLVAFGHRRRSLKIAAWEHARADAQELDSLQARTRSSAELHEELERWERSAGS